MNKADTERLIELSCDMHDSETRDHLRIAAREILALREENAKLKEEVQAYRDGITWDTTCLQCAHLMNKLYEADQVVNGRLRDVLESAPICRVKDCEFRDEPAPDTGKPCTAVHADVDEEAYAAWFYGPRKEALK